jgi:hypothetical protein
LSVSVFGLPISAPSITLTDAAGLITDAVTADVVTATSKVVTPQVAPAAPTAGTGAAGVDLRIAASSGATSAGAAGGVGGDLELFAGAAGDGTGDANGGSVILQPGMADGSGFSGLVRVQNGPLVRQCSLRDKGAAGASLSVGDLRGALIFGANASGVDVNYALPAASAIVQGFPGIQQNDTIFFSVVNKGLSPNGVNITLPIGSTSQGSVAVAFGSSASFALIMTNVSAGTEAFTLYRMS